MPDCVKQNWNTELLNESYHFVINSLYKELINDRTSDLPLAHLLIFSSLSFIITQLC